MKNCWVFSISFLFICLAHYSRAVNPGLKAIITSKGLAEIDEIADPLVTSYIRSLEPLSLPYQAYQKFVLIVNFTELILFDSVHTSFDISILPNEGLRMKIGGFGAKLHYKVDYAVEYTSRKGSFEGTAIVNQSTIVLDFAISSSAGKPSITLKTLDLTIGYLDPGATPLVEDLFKWFRWIFEWILSSVASSYLPPMINAELQEFLPTIPMQMFLDSNNLTMINLELTSNPLFTADHIELYLNASIYPVSSGICPWSPQSLPDKNQRDIEVYLDSSVLNCLLYSYQSTGALNSLANSMLHQEVPLDNRMALELLFNNATIQLYSDDINVYLIMDAIINRTQPTNEAFITINFNLSSAINLSLNTVGNVSVVVQVEELLSHLKVSQIAPDFPPKYQQEIQNTNFTALAEQADEFLKTTVLPAINSNLKSGISIPYIGEYMVNPELFLSDSYVYLSANFKAPPSN